MTTANELRAGLLALAKRSVSIMTACTNTESTKLYLVLPFLGLLGYDYTDPFEVYPDHVADLDPSGQTRADFSILNNGLPTIAVCCRPLGADLAAAQSALKRYFDTLPEVKLAILTNGIRVELFVDTMSSGLMDDEPFLVLDLEAIARAGVADESVEALLPVMKSNFDPDAIAEVAHIALVKRRLRGVFVEEANGPSEAFCRFALDRIGIAQPPRQVIERYYAPLIRTVFGETSSALGIEKLRASAAGHPKTASLHHMTERLTSIVRELSIVAHVRRRLAYLAETEAQYAAIDTIGYKDYVGKLVVYVERERVGRLFDYLESADGLNKFVFPEPFGEITTSDLSEIDVPLRSIYLRRLRELGRDQTTERLTRRA